MNSNDGCFRVSALIAVAFAVIMFLLALAPLGIGPFVSEGFEYTNAGFYMMIGIGVIFGAVALVVAYVLWPRKPSN